MQYIYNDMTERCILCGGSEDSMLHSDYADWVSLFVYAYS